MSPNVARPVAWIIQFVLLAFWVGVVPYILWRVYAMSKDVADIKVLLKSLLEEQRKGRRPLPEPRPESLES